MLQQNILICFSYKTCTKC